MTTFTNHKDFGGDFGKEMIANLKKYDSLEIASGYFGVSLINQIHDDLLKIAKRGYCKILIGMIYHEGVGREQKKVLLQLNDDLKRINSESGVYIALRQYHGKIYKFKNLTDEKIYVGSSNLSASGFYSNCEFNSLILDDETKNNVSAFLNYLLIEDFEMSAPLEKVELFEKGTKKKKGKKTSASKNDLKSCAIKPNLFPKDPILSTVSIELRVDEQPNSSLNLYFDKGRKNLNGKYMPRPWNEVEITSIKADREQLDYPKGEFEAYAQDGTNFYKIPMITASDNFKAITSKGNREVLGELIKGKLEQLGYLERYERITSENLTEYGKKTIELNKFADGKYYLVF